MRGVGRDVFYSLTQTAHIWLACASAFRKEGNIKVHVYVLTAFLVAMLAGCATPRDEFLQARSVNTVSAYQHFIDAHPRGEYADQARTHLANLKQQQETKEKYRLAAIAKLKTYVPNVTKEQQFFADGWNIKDLIYGRVGILGASVKVDDLELTLGFVESFHSLYWQSSSPTMNLSLVEDLSTYDPKTGDALLANVLEARKHRKFYTVQYHFYKSGSDDVLATQLCTLRFKRGTLTAVQWLK